MKNQSSIKQFRALAGIAFMAALIAAGSWFHMPVGPVPITFQEVFIILAGLALGPRQGALAVLLFLLAGLAGLPVFSAGKSGPAVFLGPTGGYLPGFVVLAVCAGLGGSFALKDLPEGAELPWIRLWAPLLGCCAGMSAIYGLGALRLAQVLGVDLGKALAVGVVPFLPLIPLKLVLAVLLWRALRRRGLTAR